MGASLYAEHDSRQDRRFGIRSRIESEETSLCSGVSKRAQAERQLVSAHGMTVNQPVVCIYRVGESLRGVPVALLDDAWWVPIYTRDTILLMIDDFRSGVELNVANCSHVARSSTHDRAAKRRLLPSTSDLRRSKCLYRRSQNVKSRGNRPPAAIPQPIVSVGDCCGRLISISLMEVLRWRMS